MNPENFICKLLVEGNNDLHILMQLCNHYNVEETFDIVNCEGKDNLMSQLNLRLSHPSINQIVGVLVDADLDCKCRYKQIADILKPYGYELPDVPPKDGLILRPDEEGKACIGIWIMPDNSSQGMIEDFALSLIDPMDVLLQKAESTIVEIEEEKICRYKPVHRSKAKLHTYLAWNDEPGLPIGQAIKKNLLNADSEYAQVFMSWIFRLYNQKS